MHESESVSDKYWFSFTSQVVVIPREPPGEVALVIRKHFIVVSLRSEAVFFSSGTLSEA